MKNKKRKSKEKPLYDENGRWVEERPRIKGALRKAFRLSPQIKEALSKARVELPPLPKKDGSPGKKIRVRFRCAHCNELFPMKVQKSTAVQVDHIEPVVPLWIKEVDMSLDDLARNIFCNVDNLQVLCSVPVRKNNGKPSCHKIKTDEENWIRKKFSSGYGMSDSHTIQQSLIPRLRDEYKVHLKEKNERKPKRPRKSKKRRSDSK